MPSISKAAIQMMFLFALACAWAVSSGWKQKMMSSLEISHTNKASSILSVKKQVDISSKASVQAYTSGADIDPVASAVE